MTDGVVADLVAATRDALEPLADPERAVRVERYMKGCAPFLGIPMQQVHRSARPVVAAGGGLDGAELLSLAEALWRCREREFHYVAIDVLRRWADRLGPDELPRVEQLIRTTSWWDTVDLLASRVVGPMVAAHPRLALEMDRWIDDDDIWVARSAILHQLGFGADTDAARLFDYVDRRAGDTEFFVRKACGWALREYATIDPDAVRSFVATRDDRLSGLTRREALKHLR